MVLLVAAVVPLLCVVGALGVRGAPTPLVAAWNSTLAFVASLTTAVAWWAMGEPAATWLRVDAVTVVLLCLVTFLGQWLVRFTQSALTDVEGRGRCVRLMFAVLALVTTLVLANHLILVAVLWTSIGVVLRQLLLFFPERAPAQAAAHKKFIVSRMADVALLVAAGCFTVGAQSLHLEALNAAPVTPVMQAGAAFVALAVVLRSAQLPFHGWLLQVMEAPTPVSALLHAGVVNIGAVVLLRLAPLVDHSPAARLVLIGAGALTAAVASLVMMTRVTVKVSLAWSTCAQLGFMVLQCGLGAWHLALWHLVAHSLFKAHAFLTASSTVDVARLSALLPARPLPKLGQTWLASAGLGLVAFGLGWAVNGSAAELLFVAWTGVSFGPILVRPGGLVVVVAAGAATAVVHQLAAALVSASPSSPLGVGFAAIVLGLVWVAQGLLVLRPSSALSRALAPRLFAGLFLDEVFTWLALRVWPMAADARRPRRRQLAVQGGVS